MIVKKEKFFLWRSLQIFITVKPKNLFELIVWLRNQ
jgi:hypothetical protein